MTDFRQFAFSCQASLPRAGLGLVLLVVITACGITAPLGNEGYANLESPGAFDTDRVIALSIGKIPLKIASWALDEDEPELAALVRDLEGVRVRVYEIDGDATSVAKKIRGMSEQLRKDNWQPVMLVQEDNVQTYMLMRSRGDRIQGLTLISADESEAVVINLMGHLDPSHFSDVMDAIDVDAPDIEVADPAT